MHFVAYSPFDILSAHIETIRRALSSNGYSLKTYFPRTIPHLILVEQNAAKGCGVQQSYSVFMLSNGIMEKNGHERMKKRKKKVRYSVKD